MKRPIGVVLASIILGISAAAILLGAFGMLTASVSVAHHSVPFPVNPNGPPPPSSQTLAFMMGAMAFVALLIAAWVVATLIGLLRLKNWARYSVLTMAGLLVFFGLSSLGVVALVPAILHQSQAASPTPMPENLVHGMMVAMGLFYFTLAAVGAGFLTYFNLRSVKAYFLPNVIQSQFPYPPTGSAYDLAASLATPGGLYAATPPPPAPLYPQPSPSRFSRVPTSITVIAILFLFGAACTAIFAFLPFPAFFLGATLVGAAGHGLYAVFALVSLLIGIGLIRLDNRARLLLYFFAGLTLVNSVILLTPYGQQRQAIYNQALLERMHMAGQTPAPQHAIMIFSVVLVLAMYGVIFYLIERHRSLFTAPQQRG